MGRMRIIRVGFLEEVGVWGAEESGEEDISEEEDKLIK